MPKQFVCVCVLVFYIYRPICFVVIMCSVCIVFILCFLCDRSNETVYYAILSKYHYLWYQQYFSNHRKKSAAANSVYCKVSQLHKGWVCHMNFQLLNYLFTLPFFISLLFFISKTLYAYFYSVSNT